MHAHNVIHTHCQISCTIIISYHCYAHACTLVIHTLKQCHNNYNIIHTTMHNIIICTVCKYNNIIIINNCQQCCNCFDDNNNYYDIVDKLPELKELLKLINI